MVTPEEIDEYESEHDDTHPVFDVEHLPERIAFTDEVEPAITPIDTDSDEHTLDEY